MSDRSRFARHRCRVFDGHGWKPVLWLLFTAQIAAAAQITGPLVASGNPNYFKDANGKVLILSGSQTWNTLQDWGSNGSLQPIDFNAYVSFLTTHGHNFTLLWTTELPKFCSFPSTASSPPDLTVGPLPWMRAGPGNATDGGLKFDLTKLNRNFFDRLRTRTQALNNAGIYAGVYLFTGEWLNIFRCSSDGYPFTGANNINGADDGYTGGKEGTGSITMTAPNAITGFQDAYVEKMIDTLNDLPNVLWIVSEEAPANSTWWNTHQIGRIRAYESKKPHQHPIGCCPHRSPGRHNLQLGRGLGSTRGPNFAGEVLWKWASSVQSEHQRQRPFVLGDMEGHSAGESKLCMGELHEWQPRAVHGPLPRILPARKQKFVRLSEQCHLQWAGQAMG
jgi:hypothetical protein